MTTIKSGVSRFVLATAALLTLTSVAWADPIPTVFNTGVDSGGVVLPDGTIGDPHYSLISVPDLSSAEILVRSDTGVFPTMWYIGDNTLSRWIGPNNNPPGQVGQLIGPVGFYVYRIAFSLAGFDPNSAVLKGLWATDNSGIGILLNDSPTGNVLLFKIIDPNPENAFNQLHLFSITTGFSAGLNTLDFIVENEGVATALRVQFTEATANTLEITTTGAPVPEPGTLALVVAGLVGLGALLRRRLS